MNLGQISSCSRWKSKPQSFKSVFFFHVFQISKGNSQYHKIFKELSKEEQLIQSESVMITHLKCWLRGKIRAKNVNYILTSPILVCLFCKTVSAQLQRAVNEFLFFFPCSSGYTCALQKDILYQGRMFVSDHWICFHSKVFGKDTKVLAQLCLRLHVGGEQRALLWNVKTTCLADSHLMMLFWARSPFPWCRSPTSRRPKPPFWCQMLWWSQQQAIRSGGQLIVRSRLRNQDC